MKTMENCLMAVYGTLLTGYGNWRWALADVEMVEASEVKGFDMYTHGGYPGIFASTNPDATVKVEVFDISTHPDPEGCWRSVDGMEFGAGYKKKEVTTVNGTKVMIYYMEDNQKAWMPEAIESGSWAEYCESGA